MFIAVNRVIILNILVNESLIYVIRAHINYLSFVERLLHFVEQLLPKLRTKNANYNTLKLHF